MRQLGGGRAVRALLVSLAVLLPAGALAAASIEPPGARSIVAGGRVGAAAIGLEGVPGEPVTTTTTAVASTTSTRPAAATSTSTPPRPSTTTTRRPPASTTSTAAPPSRPASTLPTTTVATVPLPSRWSAAEGQLSVAVRMEPPAPVAGQPVTFTVTVAPGVGCCLGSTIEFGDEVEEPYSTDPLEHHVAVPQACGKQTPSTGARTHTYAEGGAYLAVVRVIGLECLSEPDANGVPTGKMVAVAIPMCIGVGPSHEARRCAR